MLMLPLEQAATRSVLAMVTQLALFAYLLAMFVISLRHVYRVSWLEAASQFTMPESVWF